MRTVPTFRHGRVVHYETGDRGGIAGVCSILFIMVLLIIVPIIGFVSETAHYQTITSLLELIESDITPLTRQSKIGEIVHLQAETVQPNNLVEDLDTGVSVQGAIAMRRRTEYCQWIELKRETCNTCTREVQATDGSKYTEQYDCDCTMHYDYVKSWQPRRIVSFLFDQPVVHDNPQRDPLPSTTIHADQITVQALEDKTQQEMTVVLEGGTMLNKARAPWRRLEWTFDGRPPPEPSFFLFAWWRRWRHGSTRYDSISLLRDTNLAPAATLHNFVYVGDGYFFSPYVTSQTQNLLKWLLEYMEGTLFDWQLGDLMPSCTAGDIRFSYDIQDPSELSAIGQVHQVVTTITGTTTIQLGGTETTGDDVPRVGMVHAGRVNVDHMLKAEESDSWWRTMAVRMLLLLPWTVAMTNLISAFCGVELHELGVVTSIMAVVSVWLGTMGGIWAWLWGITSIDTVFALGCAALGFVWVVVKSWAHKSSSGKRGGFRAVWCMVGRWARVPPSWRKEASYGDDQMHYTNKHD